jgi:uncharacterized membrane protein YbhN (UPF0104 family)
VTRAWPWLRAAVAAALLALVVWRLGTGPFLDGIRAVDGGALAVAGAVGLVTTVCCAWRWTVVARGLGVPLPMSSAVTAYYRSVFLNLSLPGGVAGDVHRGVRHGRDVQDVGRALRAVVWERAAGQFVQAVLTVVVLLALPSPVRSFVPSAAAALVALALAVVLVGRSRLGAVAADIRGSLLRKRALPVVVLASAVVVLGHAVTFLVAARTAGVDASAARLLPLALLAMLGMVLPSIAGWGPREGVTAWIFSAAGLGAGLGAATAVTYGVLALAASLPGAFVLLADWASRPTRVVLAGRSR